MTGFGIPQWGPPQRRVTAPTAADGAAPEVTLNDLQRLAARRATAAPDSPQED